MITQTAFTNGILVAMAVMAMIITADPPENQENKLIYFGLIIFGGVFIGALFILLTSTLPV